MPNDQSHDPRVALAVNRLARAVSLSVAAVASGGGSGGFIDIDYTLDQVQTIFAVMNTEPAPADAIWASALAPDQSDAELTQDGSESNPYSLRRAIYSATPGKHVLLKDDGEYSQSYPIQTSGQYDEDTYIQPSPNLIPWSMTEPSSEAEAIVVRGEPGTCPAWDCTAVEVAFDIAMDFIEVCYIRFNNAGFAVSVSNSQYNFGGSCQGAYAHHNVVEFYQQFGGSLNVAALYFQKGVEGVKPRAEYNFVKGNSSTTNRNNSCLFLDYNNIGSVKGNYFYGVIPQVVYFKHGNDYSLVGGVENVDFVFENNYCDGNVSWAASGSTVKNNIVTGDFKVIADGGGSATDQDYNLVDHNTIIGDLVLSKLDHDCDNNVITNNIANSLRYQSEGPGSTIIDPATNTNTSDRNLINAADDGQRFLWGSEFADPAQYKTLSQWQSYISLDLNSAVAANQLSGQGTFTTMSDYELVSGSAGLTLASDGGAVGAATSLVGVQ